MNNSLKLHFQPILNNSYLKYYHLFNQLTNKNNCKLLIELKIFNLDQFTLVAVEFNQFNTNHYINKYKFNS